MSLLRFLSFLAVLAVAAGASAVSSPLASVAARPMPARNLFAELLGKSEAELDAKIAGAWQHLFEGDEHQRVYYPVGGDMAYIADVGSSDVRSEGMSYGMMLAVQLDKQAEFDRLWRWADRYMLHHDGPRRGYFAWQCRFDGTVMDPGSASDGEEWFVTALFFASHRWGDSQGLLNYGAEAQALLREMRHKPVNGSLVPIFDPQEKQVVFAPDTTAGRFTDPSYHLPAFYELWARWAADKSDRRFWAEAATASRTFFRRAAHPQTGLMPEYAHFDGSPYLETTFGGGKGDFRFDAWRILANVSLDHAWWQADPWQQQQSNRVLRFFAAQNPLVNQYTLDGKPLSSDSSIGLTAMAAVAGQAGDPALARPFVRQLWDAPPPSGKWRYYDGLIYFLGLLQTGGRFHVYPPAQK